MYRGFLERMINHELIVTAKVLKFGRSFHNPPQPTFMLESPVTKNGVVIDDHIWISQKDFLGDLIPIEQSQIITFSCVPYKYYGRLNETGYGLGKIRVLKINDEAIQVYA